MQVFLARWLLPYDFGLYALALSTSFVFGVAGSAGIQTMMTQQSPRRAEELSPNALRAGLVASTAAACLMVAASPLIAALFREPGIVRLLLVFAPVIPVRSYAAVVIPILQLNLRFGVVSMATVSSVAAQYLLSLALARLGMGAMSLAIGNLAGAISLMFALWIVAPFRVWTRARSSRSISEVLKMGKWPLAGDFAIHASIKVDYFVLGLVAPAQVVGGYYFAFQLVAAATTVFYGTATNVLFPLLSRIKAERARRVDGMLRAARYLVLAAGCGSALIIVMMPSIERQLWAGKWASIVPAIAVLASAVPGQVALVAPEQLLKATGHFRLWATLHALRALGIAMTVYAIGVWFAQDLTANTVAAALALFLGAVALVEPILLARVTGFSVLDYWIRTVPVWLATVGLGWLVALLSNQIEVGATQVLVLASASAVLVGTFGGLLGVFQQEKSQG